MSKKVLAAYIPVLHRGYLDFFNKYPDIDTIYIFGNQILKLSDYLRKDLRAFDPESAHKVVGSLGRFKNVHILDKTTIAKLQADNTEIVFADDDISHLVADEYFSSNKVSYYPVFLRWDRRGMDKDAAADQHDGVEITDSEFEANIMKEALEEASKSSDIWRRVGAILILSDGSSQKAYNSGMPTPYSPWIEDDPRILSKQGSDIDVSVFFHAEAKLIAKAAKVGQSLTGSTLYVTTFPCPACAMLVANSGIKTMYYKDGYAVLDGRRILEDNGVKLIRVTTDDLPDKPGEYVQYKKS
jgi:dCMP deaminase